MKFRAPFDRPANLSVIPGALKGETRESARSDGDPALSVSVTSGKGGVGKTSLLANLAVLFAREGLRVLLLDGDLSLANIDTLLGMSPRRNLWDVVAGRRRLKDVVLDGPHGIRLVPAASGVEEMANLDDYRLEVLIRSVDELKSKCDVFLVDSGHGIQRQSLRLAQAARDILVVTTPEPTAVSNAYVTLKLLLSRPIWNPPKLVLNRIRSAAEGRRVERRIKRVARHFLQTEPEVLGIVPEDSQLLKAVHSQQPLVELSPRSPASLALRDLADTLIRRCGAPTGGRRGTSQRRAGAA
jgi:flagellar biosynthesis protein FlhG